MSNTIPEGYMKTQWFKKIVLGASLMLSAVSATVQAEASVNSILELGEQKTAQAVASQQLIDELAGETGALLTDFKVVNKQIEGLQVYNTQLQKQIANQLDVLVKLQDSIENVTVIERQIQPLILRMLAGLEQFVALDVPFHMAERNDRIKILRNNQARSDISVAEKFRQVLEAYKIESEYGRKIDTYKDTLNVEGREREVNILRVGRIALMYQTTDTANSGVWDQQARQWLEVDAGEYRSAIRKGIRIAEKQASIDIMGLPIAAPEVAQ
jgi:hypothetical protein